MYGYGYNKFSRVVVLCDTLTLLSYRPNAECYNADRTEYILWDGRLRSDTQYYKFDRGFMKLRENKPGNGLVAYGGVN